VTYHPLHCDDEYTNIYDPDAAEAVIVCISKIKIRNRQSRKVENLKI